jgi:hypothetical protein
MCLMRTSKKGERGSTMIMVAVSMAMIFAFAVLAIDITLIQLTKNQLQNAADAAALAGAAELVLTDGDQAAARAEAIKIAGLNRALQTNQQPVVITSMDVTFPATNRVRVQTHRTEASGDPIQLYFLRVVNAASNKLGNMTANATAEALPLNGSSCLKPWMFPDRWEDTDGDHVYDKQEPFTDLDGNGQYDPGEPFTDDNKNGVWDAGEFYDKEITGYRAPDHIGETVTLKFDNGSLNNFSPKEGWYQIIRFGPVNRGGPDCPGGDCYRDWIPGCEPYLVMEGDTMEVEQGAKVGPTDQGLQELIARDPGAYYDEATGTIMGSAYPTSPRLIKAAVYDPTEGIYDLGGGATKYLTVQKIVVLFMENRTGQAEVLGRFMRMATQGEFCPGCDEGFAYGTHLVQ